MGDSPLSNGGPLSIRSKFGSYAVVASAELGLALTASTLGGKTWIVIDEAVLALHRPLISACVPPERIVALAATEESKSFERLTPAFLSLLDSGFRRDCTLLAIGGGVIQDISAFIAAVLMRGVRWEFIPTTLLAQCDSCIGAKSSINIGKHKNQLGCFYPPAVIHMVEPLLATLPQEAIRSGLGEIVKFHLLSGSADWQAIQPMIPNPDKSVLGALIWKSLDIKRPYIEEDEFDKGIRNLLNYGHTFGHAYESVTGFSIPHGIAVSLGIATATYISEHMGLVEAGHFNDVNSVLKKLYHPFEKLLAGTDVRSITRAMRTDKKNVHGKTYVILTHGPGRMEKVSVDLEALEPMLTDLIAHVLQT